MTVARARKPRPSAGPAELLACRGGNAAGDPLPDGAQEPGPFRSEEYLGPRSRDVIEEASWESFPASDSPAW